MYGNPMRLAHWHPSGDVFSDCIALNSTVLIWLIEMTDTRQTPFYDCHLEASGKLVDFAGWSLPIHYGSLVAEHNAVRNDSGMFDVSHMVVSDVRGERSVQALRLTLTNDIAKLTDNSALYSCLCADTGGVVDDLIVYRIAAEHYRVISNAATRNKVLDWLAKHGVADCHSIMPGQLSMLAVQGPNAVAKVQRVAQSLIEPATASAVDIASLSNFGCATLGDVFVGRTGYTGEDGVEIVVPQAAAKPYWRALIDAGVTPCGLGARDTLRLEAGMSLYGNDLDDEHSPFESGIGWTVDFADESRNFVGRSALAAQEKAGTAMLRIGIELQERGVLRAGQPISKNGKVIGVVTSGTYSPTLQRTIALARVKRDCVPKIDDKHSGLTVEIRSKPISSLRVGVPFLPKR